jgi:hypothetical protein
MWEAMTKAAHPRNRELALRSWSWRIGTEAAIHRIALDTWMIRGGIVSIVGFSLAIAGGISDQPIIWGVGLVVLATWPIIYVRAALELRRMNRAISSTLGVPIGVRSHPGPPLAAEKYRAWCRKNGLEPYPFKPKEET